MLVGPVATLSSYEDEIWRKAPGGGWPLDPAAVALARALARVRGVDSRVLDLGCGDGRLAAEMARQGADVAGAERSEVALARARERNPSLELAPIGPEGALPFEASSFDAVLCAHVLQHVVDVQLLLSEARRVLRPAGELAIAVPWHGRVKNVVIAIGAFERHHDPLEPVVRFYTPRSLRRVLEELAFEPLELKGHGGLPLLRQTLLARARRPRLSVAAAARS